LLAVQENNGVLISLAELDMDEWLVLEGAGSETWRYPHFTIEMETGTGKTYVYLRTIYELRQRYGFSKFIIVVPSIAIYEGVLKNLEITRDHFRSLYGNELVIPVPYDGSKLSRLREFATSTFTMVMVMTIDAFIRIGNNIYKHSEKLPGERKPYQFIQETRPILILDEPQSIISLKSAKAEEALRTLHPLLALRYSATHRTSPNLVYRLTPFEAFRRNLVKKIQVCDVYERDNFNQPFLALNSISRNGRITARVMTFVNEKGQTREKEVVLHHNENLYQKTQREEYKTGYRVAEINAAENFVLFENLLKLKLNETIGPSRPEIFRLQIEETIKAHMQRQKELRSKNIKVLSLFFIDRVANYTDANGLIKRLFDDAFNRLKTDFPSFKKLQPEQVRKAYFAEMKTKSGETKALDTENRGAEREMEKEAFELIMRDKERLLSFDEPVCFIFAHSALKEGWDNPNVFQICTLNQAVSEIKKRQEIGRGLRLCVNHEGLRLFDDELNVLTVIANESYSSYAANLQKEYVAAGVAAPPPPTHAKREWAKRREKIFHGDQRFKEFWEKLSQRVTYRVNADAAKLIEECVAKLNAQPFPEPVLVVEKGKFVVTRFVIKLESVNGNTAKLAVEISDTSGKSKTRSLVVKKRDRLAQLLKDERLRAYQIVEMHSSGKNGKIIFANTEELFSDGTLSFESEAGQKPHEVTIHKRE
ncbi:MAG: DEAD/DEAH box helicase family protein, partial [bacterium]